MKNMKRIKRQPQPAPLSQSHDSYYKSITKTQQQQRPQQRTTTTTTKTTYKPPILLWCTIIFLFFSNNNNNNNYYNTCHCLSSSSSSSSPIPSNNNNNNKKTKIKQHPSQKSTLSITTFNILAPVHRSVPWLWNNNTQSQSTSNNNNNNNVRESEKEEWWKPRAITLSTFIKTQFSSSDVVILQEFWYNDDFITLFDNITSCVFTRFSERRPGLGYDGRKRQDGLAVLVKKDGRLEGLRSVRVDTNEGRIAQIVECIEKCEEDEEEGRRRRRGRIVTIANVHLSFPGCKNPHENDVRQEQEVQKAVEALSLFSKQQQQQHPKTTNYNPNSSSSSSFSYNNKATPRLELLGGDFNSNSRGLAASLLESEKYSFVNCASASALQTQTNGFGQVNLGVTHRTHRGEDVSVDHVFARVVVMDDEEEEEESGETEEDTIVLSFNATTSDSTTTTTTTSTTTMKKKQKQKQKQCVSALQLGYLDSWGTRVVDCKRGDHKIGGKSIVSDHRPVTVTLEWPRHTFSSSIGWFQESGGDDDDGDGDGDGDDDLVVDGKINGRRKRRRKNERLTREEKKKLGLLGMDSENNMVEKRKEKRRNGSFVEIDNDDDDDDDDDALVPDPWYRW